MTDSQNNDQENEQPPVSQNPGLQFQLGSLMLVTTLIGVILAIGRFELVLGIWAGIIFTICLILTARAVYHREKKGLEYSTSNKSWIFLCTFAYGMIILMLPVATIHPIVTIIFFVRIQSPLHPALMVPLQITFASLCWFLFFKMRHIRRRAIGEEKDGEQTDSLKVNQ